MEVDPPHPLGSLSSSRTNPLTFLASSSPSRALSRMWDRFSPPSVSSPFHLPHPPAFPPSFLARSGPPASPDPTIPAETDLFAPQRQIRPILEQHDSASQLSFSLRRGSEAGVGGRLPMSSVREEEAVPASRWRSASEGWESPFKLPSMPWKGKEKDNPPLESNILGYDDEACFVDGLEGKVGACTQRTCLRLISGRLTFLSCRLPRLASFRDLSAHPHPPRLPRRPVRQPRFASMAHPRPRPAALARPLPPEPALAHQA